MLTSFLKFSSSTITLVVACWAYGLQGRRITHDDTVKLVDVHNLDSQLLRRHATNPSKTLATLLLTRTPSFAINRVRPGIRIPVTSISDNDHRKQLVDNRYKISSGAPRVPAVRMSSEDEDDDYAKEYLQTLGGLLFSVTAAYYALSLGAGIDETIAGQLVLVGLIAYGTYLLFFDGGATQAGLQNQAVQQMATQEEDVMNEAPRAKVNAFSSNEVRADALSASRTLEEEGYVRIDKVLSPESTSRILEYINAKLEEKRQEAKDDLASETKNFGEVLIRQNRYDLYLDLDPLIREAFEEALTSIKPLFTSLLGADAELFELAALVSDPGAPRQPVHPDTAFRENQLATAGTAYIALQDVDLDMGPTTVVPCTATADVHEKFNSRDDGGRLKMEVLRETPNHVGVLGNGDANLIDSRLLHCGGENRSDKRRILLYFSFKRAKQPVRSGSLKFELRKAGLRLDNTAEWLAEGSEFVVQ